MAAATMKTTESSGSKLEILFYSEQFTVDDTRAEVQLSGQSSNTCFRYINCFIPGLRTGQLPFHELRAALKPLFNGGHIRGIVQLQGSVNDVKVVEIAHPDDDKVAQGEPGFASFYGRHFRSDEVEEKKIYACIAPGDVEMEKEMKKRSDVVDKGGDVVIVHGKRRTVLRLYDFQSGAKLQLLYHPKQFSVVPHHSEVQSKGEFSDSVLRLLNCVIPGLQPERVAFDDVRAALQPLFYRGNIRSIMQYRGAVDGTTVVDVAEPDEDEDAEGEQGFASIDGRLYSRNDVDEKMFMAITASGDDEMEKQMKKTSVAVVVGGHIVIARGERRTVLSLYDLLSSGK